MAKAKPRTHGMLPAKDMSQTVWSVAIYIRLSREDGSEESESVVNQKKILAEYMETQFSGQYTLADFYVDDGLSGTDDTRASFMRVIQDIEEGRINCVVCKTLSRAFRNYSDQGYYLESYFPQKNVRFISTGDPKIDTYTNPEAITGLEVPITGLMNDRFAAKTSCDVRRTLDHKRRSGAFIGAFAPYGYLKDPKNKNQLILDEEIVPVKREMLQWFIHGGMSLAGIAKRLNAMGVPNPTAYKHSKGWQYRNPHAKDNDGLWTGSTVRRTLENKINLGHMVQGRQRVVSYKVHDKVAVPEEEWYIVENTHAPTFTQEEYDALLRLLERDTRTPNGKGQLHLFSGFMRCAGCRKALQRKASRGNVYYVCRTNTEKSKTRCTRHSIRADILECAVLTAVQAQIAQLHSLEALLEEINTQPAGSTRSERIDRLLNAKNRELERAQFLADGLYADLKTGLLQPADYKRLKAKYDGQIAGLAEAAANLKAEQQQLQQGSGKENEALAALRKHRNVQTLDRALLAALVDAIYVHENKDITIAFRFADDWKRITPFAALDSACEAG